MAQEFGLTVSWALLKKNRVIVLDRIQTPPIDKLAYRVGLNLPIHTTSVGKILLACLPEKEQDAILKSIPLTKVTEASVVEPKAIKKQLKKFREQGFSTDAEETYEGINCIAVPIQDREGCVIAAISLMSERSTKGPQEVFGHVNYLKDKALFISRQLGFRNL